MTLEPFTFKVAWLAFETSFPPNNFSFQVHSSLRLKRREAFVLNERTNEGELSFLMKGFKKEIFFYFYWSGIKQQKSIESLTSGVLESIWIDGGLEWEAKLNSRV